MGFFQLPSWLNDGSTDDPAGGKGPQRNNGAGGLWASLWGGGGKPLSPHDQQVEQETQQAANRRAGLAGIHSSAADEIRANAAPDEVGNRMPNTQVNTARFLIRNARRGTLDPTMMDKYLPGATPDTPAAPGAAPSTAPVYSPKVEAERNALSTLESDFSPLRTARTNLQSAREAMHAPGADRAELRPDLQDDRQALRAARQQVWRPERMGLTQAEYAARTAAPTTPTPPSYSGRPQGRGMGR